MVDRNAHWLTSSLIVAAVFCSACDDSVDASYRTNLVTLDELHLESVQADAPLLFFVDALIHNNTSDSINNVSRAKISANETSGEFELWHNQDSHTLVGCVDPDPWDILPHKTKPLRLRVDLRSDPIGLDVACKFDPQTPGFTHNDSRPYTAPRVGPALPVDFVGRVQIEFRATMNARCTPESCPMYALIQASGPITPPP